MCRLARLATHQAEIRLYPFTTVPALAWLVASALSAVSAREVDLALIQIGQMTKLFLLYIVVANCIEDEADIKWLVWALLVGALFEGLLGISQWVAGRPLGLSFLGEANHLFYGRPLGHYWTPQWLWGVPISNLTFSARHAILGRPDALQSLGWCRAMCRCSGTSIKPFARWFAQLCGGFNCGSGICFRRTCRNLQATVVGAGSILLVLLMLMLSQRDLITARLTSSQANE